MFSFGKFFLTHCLCADQTYSDKLRNRKDSEKFHEMEKAAETPPKTCFLLDDDGEFPPVAFAAS